MGSFSHFHHGHVLELYAATGNAHNKHVEEIASTFNATVIEIAKDEIPQIIAQKHGGIPKREYIAFDNTVFTDKNLFAQYERNYNPEIIRKRKEKLNLEYQSSNGRFRKPRANKAKTVARLEPNQDFTTQGVTNSLKILEDKLLTAYNEISDLRIKFEKIIEYQALLKDRDDYLKSAKMILQCES